MNVQNYVHENAIVFVGVFWDIENCRVPRNKSVSAAVEAIRRELLCNYREAEFMVVCDTKKESEKVIKEFHNAQVCILKFNI